MSNNDVPVQTSAGSGCSVSAADLVIGEWYWIVRSHGLPMPMYFWHSDSSGPHAYEQTFCPSNAIEWDAEGARFFGPIMKPNARPVRTDGPPRDSGTHEAVVGREGDA